MFDYSNIPPFDFKELSNRPEFKSKENSKIIYQEFIKFIPNEKVLYHLITSNLIIITNYGRVLHSSYYNNYSRNVTLKKYNFWIDPKCVSYFPDKMVSFDTYNKMLTFLKDESKCVLNLYHYILD